MKRLLNNILIIIKLFLFFIIFIKPILAVGCFADPASCQKVCGLGNCQINTGLCSGTGGIWTCINTGGINIGRDFSVGGVGLGGKVGYNTISDVLSSILPNIYIIAGIILLFLIIGGGFAIMTAVDDPQKKGQGGKAITSAIIGFLILFASYWIIQIIEKITGVPILDTSKIPF